jgi:hypothetical protein
VPANCGAPDADGGGCDARGKRHAGAATALSASFGHKRAPFGLQAVVHGSLDLRGRLLPRTRRFQYLFDVVVMHG